MMLSSVVLPLPDGPTKAAKAPASMAKLTSFNAGTCWVADHIILGDVVGMDQSHFLFSGELRGCKPLAPEAGDGDGVEKTHPPGFALLICRTHKLI